MIPPGRHGEHMAELVRCRREFAEYREWLAAVNAWLDREHLDAVGRAEAAGDDQVLAWRWVGEATGLEKAREVLRRPLVAPPLHTDDEEG